jgi:hypothetical protein
MHALIAAVLFAQAIGVPPQPSCDGNPSKEHPGYKTQAAGHPTEFRFGKFSRRRKSNSRKAKAC